MKAESWQKSWKDDLKGVSAQAQKIIKSLQPCFPAYGSPEAHPLAVLNKLNNTNKHRAVLLTTRIDKKVRFVVRTNDGEEHLVEVVDAVYTENVATIPLNIRPALLLPTVNVKSSGTGYITFREAGPWLDRPVLDVMLNCFGYVKDQVIPHFRQFFQ